jgi:hypothetical protein
MLNMLLAFCLFLSNLSFSHSPNAQMNTGMQNPSAPSVVGQTDSPLGGLLVAVNDLNSDLNSEDTEAYEDSYSQSSRNYTSNLNSIESDIVAYENDEVGAPVGCGPVVRRCAPHVRGCQPRTRCCRPKHRRCHRQRHCGCRRPVKRCCQPAVRRCAPAAPVGCGPAIRRCEPTVRHYAPAPVQAPVRRVCEPAVRRCAPVVPVGCGPAIRRCEPVARRCHAVPVGCGPVARRYEPTVRRCAPGVRRCAPVGGYEESLPDQRHENDYDSTNRIERPRQYAQPNVQAPQVEPYNNQIAPSAPVQAPEEPYVQQRGPNQQPVRGLW